MLRKLRDFFDYPPKFCSKCGEKLIRKEFNGDFDRYTGKLKNKTVTLRCPNLNDDPDHDEFSWEEKIKNV